MISAVRLPGKCQPHHFDVPLSNLHKQDARKQRGVVEDKEWFAITDRREGAGQRGARVYAVGSALRPAPVMHPYHGIKEAGNAA